VQDFNQESHNIESEMAEDEMEAEEEAGQCGETVKEHQRGGWWRRM
jgi:hypothetical protein